MTNYTSKSLLYNAKFIRSSLCLFLLPIISRENYLIMLDPSGRVVYSRVICEILQWSVSIRRLTVIVIHIGPFGSGCLQYSYLRSLAVDFLHEMTCSRLVAIDDLHSGMCIRRLAVIVIHIGPFGSGRLQ